MLTVIPTLAGVTLAAVAAQQGARSAKKAQELGDQIAELGGAASAQLEGTLEAAQEGARQAGRLATAGLVLAGLGLVAVISKRGGRR